MFMVGTPLAPFGIRIFASVHSVSYQPSTTRVAFSRFRIAEKGAGKKTSPAPVFGRHVGEEWIPPRLRVRDNMWRTRATAGNFFLGIYIVQCSIYDKLPISHSPSLSLIAWIKTKPRKIAQALG